MGPETTDDILNRMDQLAQSINGPGMGTSISYLDLRLLLDVAFEAQTLREQKAKADKRRSRSKPADPVPVADTPDPDPVLAAVIPALADILDSYVELWGTDAVTALKAYADQGGNRPLPDGWVPVVEAALGVG